MQNTFDHATDVPELRPIDATAASTAASGAARDDPPARRSGHMMRAAALAAMGLALVVLAWLLYATHDDLASARREVASLERAVSATAVAAAAAARAAASEVASRDDRIAELVAKSITTDDELASVVSALTVATAEKADLEQDLVAASAVVAAAGDDVVVVDALTAFQLAWRAWGVTPEHFRDIERRGIDIEGIDRAVSALGLAEDWQAWAGTNFFAAARVMGDYVRTIDDPALTEAWDEWVACPTMDACMEAGLELEGAIALTLTRTMASLRETTGAERAGGI